MNLDNHKTVTTFVLIFASVLFFSFFFPGEVLGSALFLAFLRAGLIAAVSITTVHFLFVRPLQEEEVGRRNAEDETHLAFRILDSSSEPIVITGPDAIIEYINPAFSDVTGYSKDEVIGKNPRIMKSGRQTPEFYREMWESIVETGQWQGMLWDRRKNGEEYPKWLSINSVKDETGKVLKYIGVFMDITALKQTEEHIEYLTRYDNLTGLPNRMLFRELLFKEIIRAAAQKKGLAVILLGLNRLKHINDTFGHFAANIFIKEFTERLLSALREQDILGRLEKDEFGLILLGIVNPDEVAHLAQKINDHLSRPFLVQQHEVFVTANMGIALYPSDGTDIDALIKNAQIAFHQIRKSPDKKFQFFDQSMSNKAFEHLSLEANLRRAIRNEEFVLHYQPQVELSGGTIIGMEALIRRKENNWLVPPSRFLAIAEETGLIVNICDWTLLTACIQSKKWQQEGLPPLRLAINVTAGQFYQKTLIQTVKDALDRSGLSPQFLELELTERIIVRDAEEAIRMMKELKDMGVNLSIDDFGTGYSSLSYLKRFPIDKLKIDISFVKDIGIDPNSAAIAKSIITLAHSLNLKAIAEGVETETQLKFLQEQGCDEIQGYYFSTPLPVDSFRDLVISGKRFVLRGQPDSGDSDKRAI